MLSYNNSYHSTIATTPFKLLFGEKPRMPSFPNPEILESSYGYLGKLDEKKSSVRGISSSSLVSMIPRIPFKSDIIWSAIFHDDVADIVFVHVHDGRHS
jgi:hypothetical protein